MSDSITFQLGPLTVRIEGDHLVTRWAMSTFQSLRSEAPPQLVFRFVNRPLKNDHPPRTVGDEHVRVGPDQLTYRERRYDVRLRAADPMVVDLYQRDRRPLWLRSLADPEETWKMWLSHGGSLDVHLLKEFAYTIGPLAIQCVLLRHGASLIHAGAVGLGDRGLLLPAWGGVGKSTVVARTVLGGGARFLADDHAAIDTSGTVHLHLMPIHIYRYHTTQDETICSCLLSTLTASDRIQWRLASMLRPHRVVRWIGPEDLFGRDRTTRSAAIAEVIVMFRGHSDDFVWEEVDAAAAARPCVGVILEEINGLADRLALAGSGWEKPALPDLGEACQQISRVYESAFARAHCARLLVPHGADGDALLDFLRPRSPIIREALEAGRSANGHKDS